jgi:HD-GYP domain-containing protein (c-di-GMP phosphodiesterase class II)
VADVYDALSTRRPYKDAMPHSQCVEYIRQEAGRHFDPDLAETFVGIEAMFQAIASQIQNRGSAWPDRFSGAGDRGLSIVDPVSADSEAVVA